MKATVFGAGGFVGSALVRYLRGRGDDVHAVARGDESWREQPLGHVYFCIGLTADFRRRPLDTVEAHVAMPLEILRHGRFESFLYLSSTRVYAGARRADEDVAIALRSTQADDLYNLSKLMGEAACLALADPSVRIARLSNVFGDDSASDNFLTSIARDAVTHGLVRLQTSLASTKDYVWVEDVVRALRAIARGGHHRVYNVASGRNTSHAALLDGLASATGCRSEVPPSAPLTRFPPISVARLRGLIDWKPMPVTEAIPAIVESISRRAVA